MEKSIQIFTIIKHQKKVHIYINIYMYIYRYIYIYINDKKYYQKHKETLRKEAHERYQNPSEQEDEKGLEKDIQILLKKKKT